MDASFCGIPVIQSPLCEMTVPARKHAKGRHSASYHSRIQKKWIKRFGWKKEQVVFMANLRNCGIELTGSTEPVALFAHPGLIAAIRSFK